MSRAGTGRVITPFRLVARTRCERQRILRVQAAQLVHERDHVRHGAVRQALHAHECPAASLREAGDRTCLDSVKVSHAQPPCSAVRNRPRGEAPSGDAGSHAVSRAGWPASRGTIPVRPCPGVQGVVSDRTNLLGSRTLGALGDGVLDPLVVLEAVVAVSLDGGVVDEDVGCAVVGGDETIALVRVEPLHCSLSHCAFSYCDERRDLRTLAPGCCDRLFRKPGSGIRGARGQNFAGAVTRTRTSTTTRTSKHHRAGLAFPDPSGYAVVPRRETAARDVARVQAGNLLTTGGACTSHSGVVCLVAEWC